MNIVYWFVIGFLAVCVGGMFVIYGFGAWRILTGREKFSDFGRKRPW